MNGYQQGFRFVSSFGFGGQESASKPPQAICKPLEFNFIIMKKVIPFLIIAFLSIQCSDDNEDPTIPPISAAFTASDSIIFVGEEVVFTDESTGNPTNWNWNFEGGEPEFSEEQSPTITYNFPGTYQVTLKASNENSEDTIVIDNFIEVQKVESFTLGSEVTFGLSNQSNLMSSMVILEDSSIVCTGWTYNQDTQIHNILVVKFNKDYELIWDRVIGGSDDDMVRDIVSTNDGGFLLSATTKSGDGDIPENNGEGDIAMIKLNSSGSIDWVKVYGGEKYDGVNSNSIIKLDNGYAFISYLRSDLAEISDRMGLSDIWLNEIDLNGNIINSTVIGSAENDYPYSFVKTNEGYTVLSKIGGSSNDFNESGIWLFNVDLSGNIIWKTLITGRNAGKVIRTHDGGYATLNSNDENISDLFVTKFNNQGSIEWEKSYPLPDQESPSDIIQINNDFIILGESKPLESPHNGSVYLARLNESGTVIQSISFGENIFSAKRIFETGEGKYLIGGTKKTEEYSSNFELLFQSISNSN